MSNDVESRLKQMRGMVEVVCSRLRSELEKLPLESDVIDPDAERAVYEISRDPANGDESLVGIWRDNRGQKQGEMLFHTDGSFFAEYDVIKNHPQKPQWFIEAVTAWGRGSNIKSELRLLPVE